MDVPTPSPSMWLDEGPYSCLAMMNLKVKHIHVYHGHFCINVQHNDCLLNQMLNACVFRSKPQLFITFPWNGSSLIERVRR